MKNKNGDDFHGVNIKLINGEEVGRLTNIHLSKSNSIRKVFEINYGKSLLPVMIKTLICKDILNTNTQVFLEHYSGLMTENERRSFMEKYSVKIDPKKVAEQKKKTPGEKTASVDDPNVNVPKDPDLGTEPFEKEPEETD